MIVFTRKFAEAAGDLFVCFCRCVSLCH